VRIPRTSRSIRFVCIPWEDNKRDRFLALVITACQPHGVCGLPHRRMSRFGGRKSNTREPLLPECTTHDEPSCHFTAFVA
jgi:hypothetical protein